MNANQRLRTSHHRGDGGGGGGTDSPEPGILNERVLLLILESIQWDLRVLCLVSSVNRKLRAVARRLLWRELCAHRAPRMVAALTGGAPGGGRIGGGWPAVAKLMFFCCGAEPSRNVRLGQELPGHFASSSRFSKTSGRSFLPRRCRGDVLYMSDPCEHQMGKEEEEEEGGGHQDDLGVYRGVFKEFSCSMTRACLIGRRVELEDRACPYCGARVWSMTTARLVPRSAARRLGSRNGRLEYFVCVNGHLHGTCWLAPLSSDDEDDDGGGGREFDEDEDEDREGDQDGQDEVNGGDDRAATDGSTSSTGEEVVGEWRGPHGVTR
ncbi:EID1-like F-box protein 3 [Syzygium oleosum]|uniref:EID1-like F-box protein 3 n=1 Tax=Syzygium oleosum TaxID=219896 RepID=UPI0011D18739|nr:EID1-like F-box protein 3 [Syzygium oleosum]